VKNRTSRRRAKHVRDVEERSITVTTYAHLVQYVDAFARGHLNLVILTGGPGLAKSRTVRDRLGEGACSVYRKAGEQYINCGGTIRSIKQPPSRRATYLVAIRASLS
jgi:hypothetical protein